METGDLSLRFPLCFDGYDAPDGRVYTSSRPGRLAQDFACIPSRHHSGTMDSGKRSQVFLVMMPTILWVTQMERIQASVYLSLSLLSGSLKSSVSLYSGSAPSSKSL